jgi:hypothetical protein
MAGSKYAVVLFGIFTQLNVTKTSPGMEKKRKKKQNLISQRVSHVMFPSTCRFIVLVFTVSLHVSDYMAIFKCVAYFFHVLEGFCFAALFPLPFSREEGSKKQRSRIFQVYKKNSTHLKMAM